MAETTELFGAVVNLNSSGGVVGILIDGVLHLTEEVVNLDEILMCPRVRGHGQVILLRQWVLGGSRSAMSKGNRLGHIMLGLSLHVSALGDGESSQ